MDFMVWKMHKIYEQIFKIGMMDFLSYNFFHICLEACPGFYFIRDRIHLCGGIERGQNFFFQRQPNWGLLLPLFCISDQAYDEHASVLGFFIMQQKLKLTLKL